MNKYYMKSNHQTNVEQFMRLGEQELPKNPVVPSLEVRRLRAKLILEEALETINALGFDIGLIDQYPENCLMELNNWDINLVGIIDGCLDLKVVTTGTLSACGIPDIEFQNIVDLANLEKVKGEIRKDEAGKILKPEGWQGPEEKIRQELERMGYKS